MFNSDLIRMTCCDCGVVFGMVEHHYQKRRQDGKLFHCPNGHSQSFTKTEEDRLRERLKSAEEERRCAREAKEHAELQARSLRGVITKLKRKNGAEA